MKIICRPRQSGKTLEIIKRCVDEGGYIVCYSRREADRIDAIANDLNVNIPYPITFFEFIQEDYFPLGVKKFHIDNIDLCIQMFSKVPIHTMSLTGTGKNMDK